MKEFLKCCSLIGAVFPAFQHHFIHFDWAHVWSRQCLVILAFECILNDLLVEVSFCHVFHHNERGVLIADSKYTNRIFIGQP